MEPRINLHAVSPELLKPMLALSESVEKSGLEKSLMALIKIRASQVNGCAYCLHMHTREARNAGESEERIYLLSAWRESRLYTPRERAALGWTEALTRLAETHAPDDVYEALEPHFSDEEKVKLSMMIVVINGWNRLVAGFRAVHPVENRAAAAE